LPNIAAEQHATPECCRQLAEQNGGHDH
jgi:hypothetical protein